MIDRLTRITLNELKALSKNKSEVLFQKKGERIVSRKRVLCSHDLKILASLNIFCRCQS